MARNKSEKELREEGILKCAPGQKYNVKFDYQWVQQQLYDGLKWSANDESYRGPQSV